MNPMVLQMLGSMAGSMFDSNQKNTAAMVPKQTTITPIGGGSNWMASNPVQQQPQSQSLPIGSIISMILKAKMGGVGAATQPTLTDQFQQSNNLDSILGNYGMGNSGTGFAGFDWTGR
jgi:hypothetical protein